MTEEIDRVKTVGIDPLRQQTLAASGCPGAGEILWRLDAQSFQRSRGCNRRLRRFDTRIEASVEADHVQHTAPHGSFGEI